MKTLFYRLNGRAGGGYTLANDNKTTTNLMNGATMKQSRREFRQFIKFLNKNKIKTVEKL